MSAYTNVPVDLVSWIFCQTEQKYSKHLLTPNTISSVTVRSHAIKEVKVKDVLGMNDLKCVEIII